MKGSCRSQQTTGYSGPHELLNFPAVMESTVS